MRSTYLSLNGAVNPLKTYSLVTVRTSKRGKVLAQTEAERHFKKGIIFSPSTSSRIRTVLKLVLRLERYPPNKFSEVFMEEEYKRKNNWRAVAYLSQSAQLNVREASGQMLTTT